MKWEKQGLIFCPDSSKYWQRTHAALPTALHLEGDLYRIFFTSRDADQRTYVGWFEWDASNPTAIGEVAQSPVLTPGPLGFFDDHGVQATAAVRHDGRIYLYYLGWNLGAPAPLFYTAIGLAISKDDGRSFEKYSPAPIMDRSSFDPWIVSGGAVRKEGDQWRMWYISGFKFEIPEAGGAKSFYDIKHAHSTDGIHWQRDGKVCLPLQKNESNISRPSIVVEQGRYRAWYPTKKENRGYRIGYAESQDGLDWQRMDDRVGIEVSEEGWDAEALDKQEVIAHRGKKFMLYNGNRFGFDGIGLAILTE
ncbi:MAG: hypothetical protein ACFB10_11385 [Salibacteraceae bacterium]